jgi:membrane-associated phospholipid phosphatase
MPLLVPRRTPSFDRHPLSTAALARLGGGAVLIVLLGWALGAPLNSLTPLPVEEDVMAALAGRRTQVVTVLLMAVTTAGDLAVSVVLCAIAAALARWRTGTWAWAWLIALALLGSLVASASLKLLVGRARPVEALVDTYSAAFPSGHAARAAALLGLAVWAVWRLVRLPAVRATGAAVLVVLIVASGAARVYLGAHWPSDVVFGAAVGACWLVVLLWSTGPRVAALRGRDRGGGTAARPPPDSGTGRVRA